MLTSLGLSKEAETVYRTMLVHRDWGTAQIAESLSWQEPRVRRVLDELADLELLRPSWSTDPRMRLVDPRVALEVLLARRQALVARQQQEMETSRAAIAELITAYADDRPDPGRSGVERLTDLGEIRDLLEELGAGVRRETLSLAPGGPQTPENRAASRPVVESLLSRGIQVKTVYQSSTRNDPGSLAHANWLSERGGQTRTTPVLPMRMQIVDREVAVVPIDPENSALGAVVIREPGALTGLCALFDRIWEEAEPFGTVPQQASGDIDAPRRELLRLLSAGLTDEAAARRLGVSLRTERRMISELMEQLNAQSRFQLGQRAMQHGLL